MKPRSPEKGPGRGGGNAACYTEAGVCVCLGPARTADRRHPLSSDGKSHTDTHTHTHTHTQIKHYTDTHTQTHTYTQINHYTDTHTHRHKHTD